MCGFGHEFFKELEQAQPALPPNTIPLVIAMEALRRIGLAGLGMGVDVRECRYIAMEALNQIKLLEREPG